MARCILFVLSKRGYGYGDPYEPYGCTCAGCGSCAACNGNQGYVSGLPWVNNSGLFNSCSFVVDMLNASGIGAQLIQVNDAAEIDCCVAARSATDVVIEALFVPPAVLNGLAAKFPLVRWFIRNHSEIPFLVNESQAMQWIFDYLSNPAVSVGTNTTRSQHDYQQIAAAYFPHWDQSTLDHRLPFLPNYYPAPAALPRIPSPFGVLNVGCLGAIRPLKNQLLQAIAALAAARSLGKRLAFHVNASRVEAQAPAVLRNLRALFANTPNADLVEQGWLPRPSFMELVRTMDLGMQVSLSETFNIVAADFVTNNIPIVVSPEIIWTDAESEVACATDGQAITAAILNVLSTDNTAANRSGLLSYNQTARAAWMAAFGLSANGWTDRPASFVARPAITSHATHS